MIPLAIAIHYFYGKSSVTSECVELLYETLDEVCQEYKLGRIVGGLCTDICHEKSLRTLRCDNVETIEVARDATAESETHSERGFALIDCPDQYLHGGKEIVVALILRRRKFILKARRASLQSVMQEMPTRQEVIRQREEDYFAAVINDSLTAFAPVAQEISQNIHHLTPWHEESLTLMNLSSWRTLSLLSQDPEFLMTRLMQSDPMTRTHPLDDKLFPSIDSSCGHLFIAEYADNVLDSSYIIPYFVPYFARSPEEKIETAIKLLQFLIRFTNQAVDRMLCDVKLNQFASFSPNDQLLLIDSDMIYTKEFVEISLRAVPSCKSNDDCDFFDCKGICIQTSKTGNSGCRLDDRDNNLKRMCRNIIFPFSFNLFALKVKLLGLLSDLSSKNFAENVSQIEQLCESSSGGTMLQAASQMLQIMEEVQMKFKNSFHVSVN